MLIEHFFSNIQGTMVFILFLGILVTVHEWGHFITARRLGVTVERFSFGFGPKLFSRMHQGTEFLVCLIPLGGYVKLAGDERTTSKGRPDELYSKPPGLRALIVLNGPVVNFILAYICFVLVFMIGYQTDSAKVGEVLTGYPAQEAGLQPGDKILEVDAKPIYGWAKLKMNIAQTTRDQIHLKILRDGQEITKTIVPKIIKSKNIFGQMREQRSIGITPFNNEIGTVLKNLPAEGAGLRAGDKIIQVDSQEVSGWSGLQKSIAESKGDRITLKILRGGQDITVAVVPKIDRIKSKIGQPEEFRSIGITPASEVEVFQLGFVPSLKKGFQELIELTILTYQSLYYLATGSMTVEEGGIGGPVIIFTIVKAAAEMGLSPFLYILAAISASLAIFNLLPVIPLDGGHLLLFGIEKIRGRPLSPRMEENIVRVGFSLLILLALFVTYMDFEKIGVIEKIKGLLHLG
ncbi:MAG TPA: RIP metalloprotease RseP [Candidatus Omnitrophica bacterium]|nr:MAG: RIP metalloprotease RseP [Omnitrophica WOR_2 bacterium GWA2_45_18]HBR15196.1 RIP metalloprotease RseP [Candidatus Omnitrophota bacterium]